MTDAPTPEQTDENNARMQRIYELMRKHTKPRLLSMAFAGGLADFNNPAGWTKQELAVVVADQERRKAQHREEVLTEAADELERIADETEAQVAAHYGPASGIGPGSADMVRLAAGTVRSLAARMDSGNEPTASAPTEKNDGMAHHDLCDTVMYGRDICTCEEGADDNAVYDSEED